MYSFCCGSTVNLLQADIIQANVCSVGGCVGVVCLWVWVSVCVCVCVCLWFRCGGGGGWGHSS